MINSEQIEKKWGSIDVDEISGFRFVRLSKDCSPELNIGYNSEGNRCLILELPLKFSFNIKAIAKENLSIEHIEESNYVVIQLINELYFDLFNDLILSLYYKIKDIGPTDKYVKEFTMSFGKWIEFFENRTSSALSIEELKGLFGELFILNEQITESERSKINEVLDSWVGLSGAPQDFQLPQKLIEVKTRLVAKSEISISSEYQLEVEDGKDLNLIIVTLRTNYESGMSLYELVKETIQLIHERLGDLSILYHALNEKRLTLDSLKEFNNYRYSVIKTSIYDCRQEGFPRLYRSNLPAAVTKLKYHIQINQLDEFLIKEKEY